MNPRLLQDKGYIRSGWWCQTIAVGYEYARGRRAVGQTKTAGFEIGVQKTFPISPEKAWELITGPTGRKIWLDNIPEIEFVKGQA